MQGGEGDAYLIGTAPAWYSGTAEASAAYDPAYVLPCMLALLRSGALTPALCASGGWLALALRCLAADDDDLRCACLALRLPAFMTHVLADTLIVSPRS